MTIEFPGGTVDARGETLRVVTSQDGSAPSPFELFLASIGTCAGAYVSRFFRQRGLRSTTSAFVSAWRRIP